MAKTKWNSGPPPSVGWWPASNDRTRGIFRWWDGSTWSAGVTRRAGQSLESLEYMARQPEIMPVEWTERPASWPKRSKT